MNTKKLIGTILGVILFAALIAGATFAWLSGDVILNGTNKLEAAAAQFTVSYTTGNQIKSLPVIDSFQAKPGTAAATTGNTLSGAEAPVTVITIKKPATSTTESIPDGHASLWLKTMTNNQLTKDSVVRWAICRSDPENEKYSGCESLSTSFEQSYYVLHTTGANVGKFKSKSAPDDATKVATSIADRIINTDSPVLNMGTVTAQGIIPLLSDARLADAGTTNIRGAETTANCTAGTVETAGDETTSPSMCTGTNKTGDDASTTDKNESVLMKTGGVTYYVYFWLDGENITNDHLKDQYENGDTTGEIKYDLYAGYVFASATQLQTATQDIVIK